ncbi:hypothetical protein OVA07_16565 [Novosphingobium sp. SL115]|uniref:hypothetical protein n=1 Tax=Novosphingobium sp. SL115 TaxID=2995150 RepID=UPI002276D3A7|nr:hypothetical protein [Novosphingobium sp. SL115]MCY1672612.1 hypothetical protein [Novosphingobium sp. SL115]
MRTLLSQAPTDRVGRYPKHTFQLRELPFTAVPFMIAPVLPGETLNNLYFESRVISDPVLNSIIGWKKEYYFFYVRITDLLVDAIRDMFIDPANTDLSATYGIAANSQPFYTAKGGIDYAKRSYEKIVQHFFRDEDETLATATTADGLGIVQIREQSWMDSLTDDLPGQSAVTTASNAQDFDALMDAFEQLRALGIANMSYEDFLRSYGIAIPAKDEGKPEMLARFSDYQYPSNTINPTSGTPTSALSWVFKNGSKERKFFKEPGFVIGISVTRPKIYFSGLAGNMAAHMTRAWDWMPNYLDGHPETQLKRFSSDSGPLGDRTTATDEYWADMRDLLIHGDQWQNMVAFAAAPATTGANHLLPLPDGANHKWKYPTEAMCKSFFVDAGGTNFYVRQDGYVSLAVRGKQVDFTQGNIAQV